MRQVGALPSQVIEQLLACGQIRADTPVPAAHVQPASLDLRLGRRAFRVRAAFLPGPTETIPEALARVAEGELDLARPTLLEVNTSYVIELAERFHLPPSVHACTNNKSSTGRMNVWVRTLADRVPRFDKIPAGYQGRAWVMVTPRSWPLRLQAGLTLNQARFTCGEDRLSDLELRLADQRFGLTFTSDGAPISPALDQGLLLTVDLRQPVVGYRALPCPEPLDLTRPSLHPGPRYFQALEARGGELLLPRGGFYILSTLEYLRVPPLFAVEMVAYDIHSGEYRSHFAGFFDPGFGYGDRGEVRGTPAVLELDTHEDVLFRHGQPICKMVYEHMLKAPDKIYGAGARSHYQHQRGPQVGRYFTPPAGPDTTPQEETQPR